MTTFLGGPAAGQTLLLRYCPEFLRVVEKRGQLDALDAPFDQSAIDEKITVYRLVEEKGNIHICQRGRGQQSGWFRLAEYVVLLEQPPEETLRSARLWDAWVQGQLAVPESPTGFPFDGQGEKQGDSH